MNGGRRRRNVGAGGKIAPLDAERHVGSGRSLTQGNLLNLRSSVGWNIGVRLRRGQHGGGYSNAKQKCAKH